MEIFECTHLQPPALHTATGSPTTAMRDCARVKAVFKSFKLDKNPKFEDSRASSLSLTQVRRVRTTLTNTARNSFPANV